MNEEDYRSPLRNNTQVTIGVGYWMHGKQRTPQVFSVPGLVPYGEVVEVVTTGGVRVTVP